MLSNLILMQCCAIGTFCVSATRVLLGVCVLQTAVICKHFEKNAHVQKWLNLRLQRCADACKSLQWNMRQTLTRSNTHSNFGVIFTGALD